MSGEKDVTSDYRKGQAGLYLVASVLTMVFLVSGWLLAQPKPDQSSNAQEGQVTVQGCLTRLSGDFVLTRVDPGDTYVLHAAHNVKLAKYLGQQVKVVGTKSPTLSDTSDSARATSPVTITVNSISTVSKECKD
jgi:hypothetical protein